MTEHFSPQQRLLKGQLKVLHWREPEDRLKMFERLHERIGLETDRGFLSSTKQTAHRIEPPAQPIQQMITTLQSEERTEHLRSLSNASTSQQPGEQLPKQCGSERMARQNISQKNGKSASATAALPAVRAKDALATLANAAVLLGGILAVENAVPV